MQEAKHNVVELSQYGRPHAPGGAQAGRILDDCGETLALRLGQAMAKTLKQAGDDLLELIDRVTGYEMRRLYGEAREFSRDQAAPVEAAVKKHFYLLFKRACRREKHRDGQGDDLEMSQLSLVEPDDLEESLAASNIGHSIGNICGEELFGLGKRMGVLLDDPELQFGDNPIGPEVIGAAVMEALREHTDRVKLRLALVPLIGKYLPRQVRDIYQDINRDLINKGVLPTIKVGVKRPARAGQGPAAGAMTAAAPQDAAVGEPAAASQDLLLVLQRMLNLGAAGGTLAAAGLPGGLPDVIPGLGLGAGGSAPLAGLPGIDAGLPPAMASAASAAFLQRLTSLQRGQLDAFPNTSLAAERFAMGNVNVLRDLRGQVSVQGMAQMDVMTLDIVAMVFDYVLNDRRIPDAMKALIGRLQIPVLKVAMLDRGFFSQKHHVVRRLLDALADAAVGWDEQEGHEGGLYRRVEDLVQRIVSQFDDQVDIFDTCLAEFEQYLGEENLRMAESAGRSAQLIQQGEQDERSRRQAWDTVRGHLLDKPVPELITNFLSRQWLEVLARALGRHGEQSDAWKQAVQAMDDLVWSVEPKTDPNDRRRLVELLPRLLKGLDQGLSGIGNDSGQRDEFFTSLVKCHAEAVRAGMQGAPMTAAARTVALAEPPVLVSAAEPVDFQAVPAADTNLMPSPALLREIAAVRDAAQPQEEVEEITISDVHWLAGGDFRESVEQDARVRELKRGTWIQFRQEDGQMVRAKLAWVSPLKGVYLFTNRLGQRAMSINAEGLSAKFRDGSVQLIDNVPLMDRAVSNLLERLQHPPNLGSD